MSTERKLEDMPAEYWDDPDEEDDDSEEQSYCWRCSRVLTEDEEESGYCFGCEKDKEANAS